MVIVTKNMLIAKGLFYILEEKNYYEFRLSAQTYRLPKPLKDLINFGNYFVIQSKKKELKKFEMYGFFLTPGRRSRCDKDSYRDFLDIYLSKKDAKEMLKYFKISDDEV